MIRCKIRKHTKAVAVLILCVAVCIILMAAFGGERKIPFFGTWRIEREVIIPAILITLYCRNGQLKTHITP